jgi:hypothetical protein
VPALFRRSGEYKPALVRAKQNEASLVDDWQWNGEYFVLGRCHHERWKERLIRKTETLSRCARFNSDPVRWLWLIGNGNEGED